MHTLRCYKCTYKGNGAIVDCTTYSTDLQTVHFRHFFHYENRRRLLHEQKVVVPRRFLDVLRSWTRMVVSQHAAPYLVLARRSFTWGIALWAPIIVFSGTNCLFGQTGAPGSCVVIASGQEATRRQGMLHFHELQQ